MLINTFKLVWEVFVLSFVYSPGGLVRALLIFEQKIVYWIFLGWWRRLIVKKMFNENADELIEGILRERYLEDISATVSL